MERFVSTHPANSTVPVGTVWWGHRDYSARPLGSGTTLPLYAKVWEAGRYLSPPFDLRFWPAERFWLMCWFECKQHFPYHSSVEQCPALHSAPSGGTMNCSNPIALNSYNSTCEFRCDKGFELRGPGRIRCDHTGQWTGNAPTCESMYHYSTWGFLLNGKLE